MNTMRPKTDYDIVKNVVTYLFDIIINANIMCLMAFLVAGLNFRTILIVPLAMRIAMAIMKIISALNENMSLISQKLEQYLFSGFIVSVLVCFEYLGYDFFQLQNIKILNIYKFCICILVFILIIVIHFIKNKIIDKVYQKHIHDKKYIRKCKKFSDIVIRKIHKSRCPWCGELSDISATAYLASGTSADRCSECGWYAIPYNYVIEKILNPCTDIAVWILFLAARKYTMVYIIVYIIVKIFYYKFFRNYVPYKRINGKSKDTRVSEGMLEEKFLCRASIDFHVPLREVFLFWDNRILILIAVNEKGISNSQPLCVRIIKNNEEYRLTKIDNGMRFDENGLNRFFVYLGDDKIGEGTVINH